ncbi:Hsp70 family protein [Prochlorococcus sp. MIT 1300]|uniref:Hsp70 family protein n=1 Tax=Prochlorococcus sp. MIT 1300 TaxID=3096218 RepID=UPI002A762AF3|nr:Hsp70 family protein [Prochlorococcus sp. MIT 1300]
MEKLLSGPNQKVQSPDQFGTLAIDLGNTTTVVAFQGEKDLSPKLINLPHICRKAGEVPSLVYSKGTELSQKLFGQQVIDYGLSNESSTKLSSNFKRFIGSTDSNSSANDKSDLIPNAAGELLLKKIWELLPQELRIKRLVLTAPVESYQAYRTWLINVCSSLKVDEIALVDEPTAAAMGAGLPPGSKLLVLDIGGSTIDLSMVALEGGEGRAAPVAQLLRFAGHDLEGISKQTLRCAKVLGKAGLTLGGRDIDHWIASYLFPKEPLTESLLNAAEALKCRLSDQTLKDSETILEVAAETTNTSKKSLRLSRNELERLLIERGLLECLEGLLKQTLASGRANGCDLKDLHAIVTVGGGTQIPLIKNWLKTQVKPTKLITPPPIEAVAIGALKLTPGVTIRDVLKRGVSLRCWEKRTNQHIWHPIFLPGQPWPTSDPLEMILSASSINQTKIELLLGEPQEKGAHEVIYIDGMPTLKSTNNTLTTKEWETVSASIPLNPPGQPGEDCIRLKFNIDSESMLQVDGEDLRTGNALKRQHLGLVK